MYQTKSVGKTKGHTKKQKMDLLPNGKVHNF